MTTCLTVCLGNTCLPSANMSTSNVTTSSATFNWVAVTGAVSYHVRYRIIGTTNWTMTTVAGTNMIMLQDLLQAPTTNGKVETICTSGSSIFTISTEFITIPLTCDIPVNQTTSNIYYYGASFFWDATGAISYNLRYRATGTPTWTNVIVTQTTYYLYSLVQTTEYEWQVSNQLHW